MKQFEVYYVSPFGDSVGREIYSGRPAVIVSSDTVIANSDTVSVAYLTTRPKEDTPYHVEIESTGRTSTVLCEQIRAVDKSRLTGRLCKLTYAEEDAVKAALLEALGLNAEEEYAQEDDEPDEGESACVSMTTARLTIAWTERDTYKKLYEELLDKVMQK